MCHYQEIVKKRDTTYTDVRKVYQQWWYFLELSFFFSIFQIELIAYKLFTPLNLLLIGEFVSLFRQSFRLRAARGPLEEGVLCTGEEGCRGLWLPDEHTDSVSCIC